MVLMVQKPSCRITGMWASKAAGSLLKAQDSLHWIKHCVGINRTA